MGSIAEPPCIQLFDGYALYYRRFPEICQPEKNRELWKVGFGCGVERDCGLWNGSWKIFSRWVVRYEPQATAVELAQLGGEG